MPIVESRIRNSSLQFCFIILLSILCFAVLGFNYRIFYQVFPLDFRDLPSLFLLCFGVVSVIAISSFTRLLLLFGFEYFLSGQSVLNQLRNHLVDHVYLCIVICLDIGLCFVCGWLYLDMDLKLHWDYFHVTFFASILCACISVVVDYDDVELSSSQNMEKSIGAFWAYGAHSAFYKKILKGITKRMSEFEQEKRITLLVKKLVIICPLSCNANGTLEGKDGAMEVLGSLREINIDDGAANNRKFKTNVYKIFGPYEAYIAAELPSPLSTLYEMRDVMDSVILDYHRDCFIQSLKHHLKSLNCIILEYDDLVSNPEPLHSFLLSELEDKKFVSVVK